MNMTFRTRKGITPVVAIVLLLMLTIVAVGGMWGWTSGILKQQQGKATSQLNTKLDVKDAQCLSPSASGAGDQVKWFIKNTGQVDVSANQVTVYVYKVSTGNLLGTASASAPSGSIAANGQWSTLSSPQSISLSEDFQPGLSYRVEFEFTGQNGYTVDATCQAQ